MDPVTLEGILRMVESGGVVPDDVPVDLEAQARAALAGLPVPLRRSVDPALAGRRRALGFIAAELARRGGESAELETLLREDWFGGGSAVSYLRLLLAIGRKDEAGAYARIAAGDPAEDPAVIDSILQEAAEAADSWVTAVQSFAGDLSPDRWDDLMRFVPDETFYGRTRWTFALLAGRGSRASVGLWLGLAAQSPGQGRCLPGRAPAARGLRRTLAAVRAHDVGQGDSHGRRR